MDHEKEINCERELKIIKQETSGSQFVERWLRKHEESFGSRLGSRNRKIPSSRAATLAEKQALGSVRDPASKKQERVGKAYDINL